MRRGGSLRRKAGAAITVARRAGANFTFAQLNYFFLYNEMIVPVGGSKTLKRIRKAADDLEHGVQHGVASEKASRQVDDRPAYAVTAGFIRLREIMPSTMIMQPLVAVSRLTTDRPKLALAFGMIRR